MPQPFAALESKVNASVFKHLANAEAAFTPAGGGAAIVVDVIFDVAQAVVDPETGVVVTRPGLSMPGAAVPGIAQGYGVLIAGVDYLVRTHPQLAEGGWRQVELARA